MSSSGRDELPTTQGLRRGHGLLVCTQLRRGYSDERELVPTATQEQVEVLLKKVADR